MATSLKRKLLILPPVALGVALILVMAGARDAPEQQPPSEQSRKVRVVEVVDQPVVPRVLGYGSVTPRKVWNAVAQVSAQVVHVHPDFKHGAILPAGTVLLRLAPEDFRLVVAEREANIRSLEAQRTELETTLSNTRASLEIEERSLAIQEQELERKRKLNKKGSVSGSALDAATRDTLGQRQQVQNLRNTLNLIPVQLREMDEQLAVQQAQLARARLDLERTEIRLPFNARIAEANAEITQFVQAGQQIAVADGVKTSEVEAQLPIGLFADMLRMATGGEAPRVNPRSVAEVFARIGIDAVVRLRTGRDTVEWQGRIARISDTIDPQTRTVGVIVAVDDTYANARPGVRPPLVKGMYVEVELRGGNRQRGIVLPRSAVLDGRVFVVGAESRLESRQVRTGLAQGDFLVVEEGLSPGEQVVVSDLIPAVDGMLLTVERDTGLEDELRRAAVGEGAAR